MQSGTDPVICHGRVGDAGSIVGRNRAVQVRLDVPEPFDLEPLDLRGPQTHSAGMATEALQDGEAETFPVTLTPRALEMAAKKVAEADEPVVGLRLGVKGSGCSGYAYVIEFAKEVRDGRDLVLESGALRVVIDKRSASYLRGSTLDWETKLLGYGFRWSNPNATSECGCGESFNLKASEKA